MKKFHIPAQTGWLWLSVFSLAALFLLATTEMVIIYPQARHYFDSSKSTAPQPLSARSRHYLYKSLELVLTPPFDSSSNPKIRQNLDLAYGMLNVNIYIKNYPCTTSSLARIDSIYKQLNPEKVPDQALFSRAILPILQCTEQIQSSRNSKQSALVVNMLGELTLQRKLLFGGILFALIVTLISWGLHLRHRKIITNNHNETHKWIRHALQDSLTGLFNRRSFDADLAQAVKEYTAHKEPLSLLMCDIDYFKAYNDSYGHVAGDKALQQIAATLKETLNNNYRLYRYGGEEMTVILENTDNQQAQRIAQYLLNKIKSLQLLHPTSEFEFVTTSIGCATMTEYIKNSEQLIKKADAFLYIAKHNGRNQVIGDDHAS